MARYFEKSTIKLGVQYQYAQLRELENRFVSELSQEFLDGITEGKEYVSTQLNYEIDDTDDQSFPMRGIRLKQGQAVRLETPGGGGYGEAAKRPAELVAQDVAHGLMSEEEAESKYGSSWRGTAL